MGTQYIYDLNILKFVFYIKILKLYMCNVLESVKTLKIIFLNYDKRIGNESDIYKLLYIQFIRNIFLYF